MAINTKPDPFDYSAFSFTEIPVKVGSSSYTLKEASGKVARQHRNRQTECLILKDGKAVGVKNIADLDVLLLTGCLFDHKGNNVPQSVLDTWPGKIISGLAKKAKEISELQDVAPDRKQTLLAFQRLDAPCTLEQVREWMDSLPEEEFADAKKFFKLTPEEAAKNAQSDSANSTISQETTE